MSSYSGQPLINILMNEFSYVSNDVIHQINRAFNEYKDRYFFNNDVGIIKGLIYKIKSILIENIDSYRELMEKINYETDENNLNKLIETDIYFIENILINLEIVKKHQELKKLLKIYHKSLEYNDNNYEIRKNIIDKLNSIQAIEMKDINYKDINLNELIYWDKITEKNYKKINDRGV
jgi:hypothetical protein